MQSFVNRFGQRLTDPAHLKEIRHTRPEDALQATKLS
jgi:hypothetical protein